MGTPRGHQRGRIWPVMPSTSQRGSTPRAAGEQTNEREAACIEFTHCVRNEIWNRDLVIGIFLSLLTSDDLRVHNHTEI